MQPYPFIPLALPSKTVFGFLSLRHNSLLSETIISFQTLRTIFWLAKTSNKPISLTTWLAVNPLTCKLLLLKQNILIVFDSGFGCKPRASPKLPSFDGYSFVTYPILFTSSLSRCQIQSWYLKPKADAKFNNLWPVKAVWTKEAAWHLQFLQAWAQIRKTIGTHLHVDATRSWQQKKKVREEIRQRLPQGKPASYNLTVITGIQAASYWATA